ncbi:MAG: aquaporin [Actinomycetota bacterium]
MDSRTVDNTAVDSRAVAAEFVGTAFLLAGVVGSGIMAERLSDDVGLRLLQNALATAGVLLALILTFGGVSGAHFNPAVTLAERFYGSIATTTAGAYVAAQLAGGAVGVIVANLMFDLPAVNVSTRDRGDANLVFAELIATIGLLVIIAGTVRSGRASTVAASVAGYIAGAYYFTSSTSFANPAVTIARTLSDTFAGIEPASAPAFVAAQLAAVAVTVPLMRFIYPDHPDADHDRDEQ